MPSSGGMAKKLKPIGYCGKIDIAWSIESE
jgi:hypothetical protein